MKGCWHSQCDSKGDLEEQHRVGLMGSSRIWSSGDFDQNPWPPPQGGRGEGGRPAVSHFDQCFPKSTEDITCFSVGQVPIRFFLLTDLEFVLSLPISPISPLSLPLADIRQGSCLHLMVHGSTPPMFPHGLKISLHFQTVHMPEVPVLKSGSALVGFDSSLVFKALPPQFSSLT